jgi:hypothetical protein
MILTVPSSGQPGRDLLVVAGFPHLPQILPVSVEYTSWLLNSNAA